MNNSTKNSFSGKISNIKLIFIFMFVNELFCLMLDTYGELDELFIITSKNQILLAPAPTPTSVGPSKPIPVSGTYPLTA